MAKDVWGRPAVERHPEHPPGGAEPYRTPAPPEDDRHPQPSVPTTRGKPDRPAKGS